jgi:RHS repeat-associated protein
MATSRIRPFGPARLSGYARTFRKACRPRTHPHLLATQPPRRKPRTCFEGPFGEVIRATGPMAKANPFRFSTKYQDDETDQLYYGYRYYSASTGRWLTWDPLGELAFGATQPRNDPKISEHSRRRSVLAGYVFASNTPVSHVDPTGLNVYKVTTSELCSTPLHRMIVGDDGKGGGYTLEFYGTKCWWSVGPPRWLAGGHDYYFWGKGLVKYGTFSKPAWDEIREQGYSIVETVESTGVYYYPGAVSVDASLAAVASGMSPSSFGAYVLFFNDCGSFANQWMTRASQALKSALNSAPGVFPPGLFR